MRTLLTTLLIFMIGVMGIQAKENTSDKPQKTVMSLHDEFFSNNWEIIVPKIKKLNERYKQKNGRELNLKILIIVDAKNKSIQIRMQDNFERKTTPTLKIKKGKMLYFTTGGQVIIGIKIKGDKLICVPMENGVKTGDEWDMKVYKGSVK